MVKVYGALQHILVLAVQQVKQFRFRSNEYIMFQIIQILQDEKNTLVSTGQMRSVYLRRCVNVSVANLMVDIV